MPALPQVSTPQTTYAITPGAPSLICPRCHHSNIASVANCLHCGTGLGRDTAGIPRPGDVTEASSAPLSARSPEPTSTQRPAELRTRTASIAGPNLLVIGQDGTEGCAYPLAEGQTDIGRSEGDIVLPDDRFVCPRHARIRRDGSVITIQDLASVNGIYKRVTNSVKLEAGACFLVGLALLKFEALNGSEQNLGCAVDRGTQVFGAPPSSRYARLTELTMEGVPKSIFVINREETILGREVGDIVFSSDPFMSRRHAAITRNSLDGSFCLADLGSSNGTYIRIRGQTELTPGDHVRIGQHLFRYDLNNGQAPGQGQAQAR